jgi:Replication-relaxation
LRQNNRQSRHVKTPMSKGVDLGSAPLLEALRLLGEFEVLTTSQLIRLIQGRHERADRTLKTMLTNMWRCNLVVRFAPTNNHEMAYALDRAGVHVLREEGHEPERWRPQLRNLLTYSQGYFSLEHDLLATEAMIRLLEAAKLYDLPRSYQHSPRNPTPPPHWDKLVVIDGFHIYIEADRASEKGHKIYQKVDNYLHYIEDQHPNRNACVLFVVQLVAEGAESRRVESLKGIIERYGQKAAWSGLVQFCRIVTLKRMTVEEALSEPICRIAGRDGRHYLNSPVDFTRYAGMLPGPDDLI